METVKKQRGRKKGEKMEPKAMIIDPVLDPFQIKVEESSFTVVKNNEVQPWGYYTTLSNALRSVAKFKLGLDKNKTFTLDEYISRHENAVKEITNKILI